MHKEEIEKLVEMIKYYDGVSNAAEGYLRINGVIIEKTKDGIKWQYAETK